MMMMMMMPIIDRNPTFIGEFPTFLFSELKSWLVGDKTSIDSDRHIMYYCTNYTNQPTNQLTNYCTTFYRRIPSFIGEFPTFFAFVATGSQLFAHSEQQE